MKDPRYARVKALIEGKHITQFKQIVENKNIPKSVLCKDLGMRYESFQKRLADPGLFTLNEFILMAGWIGVDEEVVTELARAQKRAKVRGKK